jgi:hypothetical protein
MPPPEITGFTLIPPDPVLPGAKIGIRVDVKSNGHKINKYWWVVEVGKGEIAGGQGTALIAYKAPMTSGSYEVCVQLEYEGGSPVEGLTKVKVVPEPTPSPTKEPTAEPTEEPTQEPTEEPAEEPMLTPEPPMPTPEPPTPTPKPDAVVNTEALNLRSGPGVVYGVLEVLKQGDSLKVTGKCPTGDWLKVIASNKQDGWVACSLLQVNVDMDGVAIAQPPPTPTPTATPTPIVTPTPTPLPPPIPLKPENGAAFLGEPADLKWQWDRPRESGEVFSVRVRREGEERLCHHDKADKPEYKASLSYCTAGTHYWSVALVRDLDPGLPEEDLARWQELSEPSEERWFYYVPAEEPWTWPTPPGPPEPEPKPGPPDKP